MIKLKEITSSEVDENSGVETVVATLYADTKAEVSDSITGFDVDGLPDECEIGYWLGVPFWGQGIMPEAVNLLLHHAFIDLGMNKVWCGYYDGNERSKRVQEKCGFQHQWTKEKVDVPL